MGPKIAIVGASGFVGAKLLEVLSADAHASLIRGLSRSKPHFSGKLIEFIACDIFSLKDIEQGLVGIDVAIYLVHSMLPSSELAQGNFEDYDLILADNFARSCVKNGVKRVLYLSGIIPKTFNLSNENLSRHLRSRLEVEKIFLSYGLKLVSLRAGIIMGYGGSSFEMILKLVERLPAMICPNWTQQKTSPIHINDVCHSFSRILKDPAMQGTFDLAGPEVLSYFEMIQITAKYLGKKPLVINFPFFSPALSRLWVSTVTGAPAKLVYPLIESLRHDMLADPDKTYLMPAWKYKTFLEALSEKRLLKNHKKPKAYSKTQLDNRQQVVQSVQRLYLPSNFDAKIAAHAYTKFLNGHFKYLLEVKTVETSTTIYMRATQKALLILNYSIERSTADRVLFYIEGGFLDKGRHRARLEFRQCRHAPILIVAIHDYCPRLPWYIYKFTQAPLHLNVMRAFDKYLRSL